MAPRPEPNSKWVTAAARQIDLSDVNSLRAARGTKDQSWQPQAWEHYDNIGEIRNAARFNSNSISRLRLFPAIQVDPDQPPVKLDASDKELELSSQEEDAAFHALEQLRSPESDQARILSDMALQFFLPGEGYLVGRPDDEAAKDDPDNERWDVHSVDELKIVAGQYKLQIDDKTIIELTPDDYVARFWNPHPRWKWRADSAMQALLVECAELDLLTRSIAGSAMSQLNAGVLLLPSSASFGPAQLGDGTGDGEAATDEFVEDLITYFMKPIEDPSSAAASVPFILQLKDEIFDKVKHIPMDRPFDTIAHQLRNELLVRLANGLEMPAEALTGRHDLNHWTGWVVQEETFRSYIEPRAIMIVDALTTAYLRPKLLAQDIDPRRFRIWYDPVDLISHPNQAADAITLWDRALINDDTTRAAVGFADAAELDDDELQKRFEVWSKMGGGAAPAPVQGPEGTGAAGSPDGTIPGQSSKPGSKPRQGGEGAPAQPLPPAGTSHNGAQTFGTTSASRLTRQSLDRLAGHLHRMDTQVRTRLQTAADVALRRALERAGARVVSRIARDTASPYKATVRSVPHFDVCRTLGLSSVIGRLDFSEEDLVDDKAFVDLERNFNLWVGRVQDQMLFTVSRMGDHGIMETLAHRAPSDRRAGWAHLHGRMLARGRSRLFGEQTPVTAARPRAGVAREAANETHLAEVAGEFDPDLEVQPGAVRGALSLASGAEGRMTAGGSILTDVADVVTGLADGPIVREGLAGLGISVTNMMWVHDEPPVDFEAHLALDEYEFSSWTDPELVAVEPWIESGFYHPGDHNGCQCSYIETYDSERGADVLLSSGAALVEGVVEGLRGGGARPKVGGEFYSDTQPRDEHGRWTSDGSSSTPETVGHFPGSVVEPAHLLNKAGYNAAHGLGPPHPPEHFASVVADRARGEKIAADYAALPDVNGPEAFEAYDALRDEVHAQYDYLTNDLGVHVEMLDHDPYENAAQLTADIRDNHHLGVLSTAETGPHPVLSNQANDEFRAVHDAFGHAAIGRSFDRNGEEAAFRSHAEMFTPTAMKALASETRGQNSALNYGPTHGEFPPQKAALLPAEDLTFALRPGTFAMAPEDGPDPKADQDNRYDETRCHHTSCGRTLGPRPPVRKVTGPDDGGFDTAGFLDSHPRLDGEDTSVWQRRVLGALPAELASDVLSEVGSEASAIAEWLGLDTVRAYSPDQPRDERGRWTDGGSDSPTDPGKSGEPGSQENPIKVTSADEAARLIAEGKYVEMPANQVSILMDRLAAIARDASARGDKAPNYDLCKVSVPDTNLFCSESQGIGRIQMPQLSGEPVPGSKADSMPKDDKGEVNVAPAFREQLEGAGFKVTDERVPADLLKATQNELVGTKVAGMMAAIRAGTGDKIRDGRIFVSRDNYVLDGHHRWAAVVGSEFDPQGGRQQIDMNVSRVDLPISVLLDNANRFTDQIGIADKAATGSAGGPQTRGTIPG